MYKDGKLEDICGTRISLSPSEWINISIGLENTKLCKARVPLTHFIIFLPDSNLAAKLQGSFLGV